MNEDKRQRQLSRENEAVASAVGKFQERLKRSPENSETGWAMLHQHWTRLADALRKEQENLIQKRKMGRDGHLFLFLDADSLAVITLQCIISERGSDFVDGEEIAREQEKVIEAEEPERGLDDGSIEQALENAKDAKKLGALAEEIGQRCQYECAVMASNLRKTGMARCLQSYKTQRTKERDTRTINGVVFGDWGTDRLDLVLGAHLLDVAAKIDIVTLNFSKKTRGRKSYHIALTDTFARAFEQCRDAQQDLLTPKYRPMIVPPAPWGRSLTDGGYLNNKKLPANRKTHLVIHRNSELRMAVLKKGNMENVLLAVNALQDTKWKINRRIYDVMIQVNVMRRESQLPDLKKSQRNRLAPLLKHGWRTVSVLEQKCQICSDIINEEEIYFPYRLDYRGRAYPLPHAVHPQADDIGRSLLLFGGTGKRLCESGERWLAIHLANAWGKETVNTRALDKSTYGERVAWTMKNSKEIVKNALKPLHEHWWMQASKPWRFLAACFEWEAFLADKQSFFSHLPVTIDGTCNGLQHLGALRLDARVATETNLMPGDQPADIYEAVAGDLIADLEEASQEGDKDADQWHWRNLLMPADKDDPDGNLQSIIIDRDACKLAVMTTPYGVTELGMRTQLFESALSAPLRQRASGLFSDSRIKEPRALVAKLRNGNEALSEFLWDCFTSEEQEAMSRKEASPQSLRGLLGPALKRIINGPLIYETQRFKAIELSDEAKRLIAKPEKLHDASYRLSTEEKLAVDLEEIRNDVESRRISRVNLLLLEDAYPEEIKRVQSNRWRGCGYLASKLKECIDRLVDPGETLAIWFQEIAMQSAEAGHGLRWTAPSGFPVLQESWMPDTKRISAGEIEVVTYVSSDERDTKAEMRKIVANYVHSLDAAHMIMTVCRLRSKGLEHFGVIHDCYAVHACDVDQLSKTLREEFVTMYRIPHGGDSLLEKFRREQSKIARKKFKPPPAPGEFDIEKVLESEYFFC